MEIMQRLVRQRARGVNTIFRLANTSLLQVCWMKREFTMQMKNLSLLLLASRNIVFMPRARCLTSLCIMRGSILPVTIPPRATPGTSPALRSRGWGIAWSRLVRGGGGRGKSKITSCCSCEVRHFSVDAGPRGEDYLFPMTIARICSRLVTEE